jgi:hypothetical protein
MKVELTHQEFKVNYSQDEFENMARNMKIQLQENGHSVSITVCLDILAKQLGFTYKEILSQFEHIEYSNKQYKLIHNWAKAFLDLGLPGWKITPTEPGEHGEIFFNYELWGEDYGVQCDVEDVYDKIWKNVSGLLYLELQKNPIKFIEYTTQEQLEKLLLKEWLPHTKEIKKAIYNIEHKVSLMPENLKTELFANIMYDYLTPRISNKILYNSVGE